MKKNIIARDDSTLYVSKQELTIRTYTRVMRENIAARAVYKTVDYVHKIYHGITQEEIDKLFDDLFNTTMDLLDTITFGD